jgi:membrane associated rhomboid family serine protease
MQLLLYIVAASLVYLLVLILRRRERRLLGFALLASANLVLAGGALALGRECELPGMLALFVFGLAVVIPAFLRAAEVRALSADRLGLATMLGSLRALLQPGAGIGEELALRRRLLAVRQGRGDLVFPILRSAIETANSEPRRIALREQLILLLVQDRRFDEAVAEWERRPLPVETRPLLASAMVRAFCEAGRVADAAAILHRLEEGPARRDVSALPHINQSRLIYLAFAGQVAAVSNLLAGSFLAELPESTRSFWIGTAALHAGDLTLARSQFERARDLASGPLAPRLRQVADARLGELDHPPPAPPVDPALVAVVTERARQTLGLARRRVRLREMPVTLAMALANAAVFAAARIAHVESSEGKLVAWGANFHEYVAERHQYWRFLTSAFLHVDWLHILSNLYVLILIGRLVEPLYRSKRFVVIYVFAALTGGLGSHLGHRGDLSIGASGAIFGILGALIALLLRRRREVPESWRRSLLVNLLILLAIQMFIDWRVPFIDNWAHLGGLVGGFVLGLAIVPRLDSRYPRGEDAAARGKSGSGT